LRNGSFPETGFWEASASRFVCTQYHMRELLRFFWNSTRGHRFSPWRSPYLRWHMETYSGLKMDKIGFVGISTSKKRPHARPARTGSEVTVTIG
jgi:hypothetical protein